MEEWQAKPEELLDALGIPISAPSRRRRPTVAVLGWCGHGQDPRDYVPHRLRRGRRGLLDPSNVLAVTFTRRAASKCATAWRS